MRVPRISTGFQPLYTRGLHRALRESRLLSSGHDAELLCALQDELEPVVVRGGKSVIREGDPSDSLYLVISGRLRVVRLDAADHERVLAEVGRGETVGEMGLITREPRTATVYAIRDSLLGRLSDASFERLLARYPRAAMDRFAGSIIRTLRRELHEPETGKGFTGSIALIPAEPDLPLGEFAVRLARHLGSHGPTLHLSSEILDAVLQRPGVGQALSSSDTEPRLVLWLGEQEIEHRFLLFQSDPLPSAWSARCIRQADRIVVVARAGSDPQPGSLERALLGSSPRQPVSLVLLREDGSTQPQGTERWLQPRTLSAHYHVRSGNEADFRRLARLVAGNGVGVVLAGGGARAVVGVGVVRALVEAGVPIDAIGGTSAGALLAGMLAMGLDHRDIVDRIRSVPTRVDYTLPIHALTRGRSWTSALIAFFGKQRIEDLPVGFFCTSVNLSNPRLIVHERGSLMHAVRASSALPGVLPPVWDDGDILIDGGLVNNLPVDIMRDRPGIGRVAGVEIGEGGGTPKLKQFGYEVSGWSSTLGRLGLGARSDVPPMISLLARTMLVGDSLSLRTRRNVADRLFRPPDRDFSLLDWTRVGDAVEVGYRYACEALAAEPPTELLAACAVE